MSGASDSNRFYVGPSSSNTSLPALEMLETSETCEPFDAERYNAAIRNASINGLTRVTTKQLMTARQVEDTAIALRNKLRLKQSISSQLRALTPRDLYSVAQKIEFLNEMDRRLYGQAAALDIDYNADYF